MVGPQRNGRGIEPNTRSGFFFSLSTSAAARSVVLGALAFSSVVSNSRLLLVTEETTVCTVQYRYSYESIGNPRKRD